jgi:sugar O-acyltransferase (sialic acid O-acetyltransferase NeuD family)
MKKLVIFGTGELAELANFYFTNDSDYDVIAFCVDKKYISSEEFLGKPLVDFDIVDKLYSPDKYDMFIAIGYSKLNSNRINFFIQAKNKGFFLASYVSSKNSMWDTLSVGQNTMIMENNTIMPFVKIGDNVLIWVGNIIAHHMIVEDHVTITSHCAIGGNVLIKSKSFIGLNSTLRNNIVVNEGCIVAASSNVTKTTEKGYLYMGNPAKNTNILSIDVNL